MKNLSSKTDRTKIWFLANYSFTTGAHARKEELARTLVEMYPCIAWIGPEPLQRLRNVAYFPVSKKGDRLSNFLLFFKSRRVIRKNANETDIFVCFSEAELLIYVLSSTLAYRNLVLFSRGDVIANDLLSLSKQTAFKRTVTIFKLFFHLFQRKIATDRAKLIVVQTPSLRYQWKFFQPLSSRVIHVLPNNSNASWMVQPAPEKRPENNSSTLRIGYVGRVDSERGLEDLVKAISKLSKCGTNKVEGYIFGKNSEGHDQIQLLVDKLNLLCTVKFKGFSSNIQFELTKLDILVANRPVDSCPNTVLEAMAVGVPVIASDIPAHRFLLGSSGLYYTYGNPFELAANIELLLGNYSARTSYARCIKERGELFKFDWAKIAGDIVLAGALDRCLADLSVAKTIRQNIPSRLLYDFCSDADHHAGGLTKDG